MENVQKAQPDDGSASEVNVRSQEQDYATGGGAGAGESILDRITRNQQAETGYLQAVRAETGFTPHAGRVLVRRDAAAAAPTDGIVMPGTDTEPPLTGVIVAVADDLREPAADTAGHRFTAYKFFNIFPGARVAFGKYAGVEVNVRGETLLVMKDEELLGVFTD